MKKEIKSAGTSKSKSHFPYKLFYPLWGIFVGHWIGEGTAPMSARFLEDNLGLDGLYEKVMRWYTPDPTREATLLDYTEIIASQLPYMILFSIAGYHLGNYLENRIQQSGER